MADIAQIGIARCLSCPKPECDDCLRFCSEIKSTRGRKSTFDPVLIGRTINLTQKEAAEALNISVTTVKRQRKIYFMMQQA